MTTPPRTPGRAPRSAAPADGGASPLPLTAYTVDGGPDLPLVPAPVHREWIAATDEGFARRCLPLMMANQSEWWILNNSTFTVEWEGNRHAPALRVRYADENARRAAFSNFGHGVLTFHLPYLFRTPPGWDLLVRGPANLPKDGITALSGLIETDWTSAFFTMNWQVTRPHHPIEFRAGEPVCALVPQRRDELTRFRPETTPLAGSPEEAGYRAFSASRDRFSEERLVPGTRAHQQQFQRHYLRGENHHGERFPEHRRKVDLQPFTDRAPNAEEKE
ncbi:DUF6065 family protein [Kitasatospora sp. NPDC058444]|uniref:DUF6065 family protein n=1 Tax=Kitasatospora sp. NPDC058444 TaxID=3346504 RepID=UPI003655237E